eukprot:9476153-Heterocapsa_arctica.AAC.1
MGKILQWDWIDFSSHANKQDLLENLKTKMTQWETNSKQCEEQRRNQPQSDDIDMGWDLDHNLPPALPR